MAHHPPDPSAGISPGLRRPRAEDPRSVITPDAFRVNPSLLGTPLAAPSRRLAAMLIDLVLLGFLINAPGWLFALLTAFVLFRATSRKSGSRGGAGRVFLRVGGAVIAFVGVLSLVSAVSGLFSDRGTPAREGAAGPVDAPGSGADPGGEAGRVDAPPSAADAVGDAGPAPTGGAVLAELFALGRARTPEGARPHAAAVARFFAAQGERLEDTADLREALRGLGELPLMAFDDDVFAVVEEEFRRAGVLPPGGAAGDSESRDAAIDSLLRGRDVALAAGADEEAGRLTREAALLIASDTIGRLGSRVSSLRSDVSDLRDRAREAERAAERSPLGLLMDLVADEIGVGAGWAALYFTAMLALWRGRTPGKRVLGIRVIRLDGKPLGWFASFERFGGYAAALATGTLGFFQILWDRNRQGVHDKISETVVIRDLAPEHVVRTRVPVS